MVDRGHQPLIEALVLVAPGTALREGLDRVLKARRGGLIVIGDDPTVLSICSGGFLIDAELSPQRLSELAKMDGAIVLAADASRIARANVHLVPKASIVTSETGTRHRTAERVARLIDVPVVAVSSSMSTITIYRHDRKHTIQPSNTLLDRAGQAVSTLQRFRQRLDMALTSLSSLEIEDTVTVRDVVATVQPGELVRRIALEIEGYLVELGDLGRLVWLQLEELTSGVDDVLRLVIQDYVGLGDRLTHHERRRRPGLVGAVGQVDGFSSEIAATARQTLEGLSALSADDLLDPAKIEEVLELGSGMGSLDDSVEARGYRQLHRLPRFSAPVIDRIVDRFGSFSRVMQASPAELEEVSGVGEAKARSIKEGLVRLAEASILERYD